MNILHILTGCGALLATAAGEIQYTPKISGEGGFEIAMDYSLKEPFDGREISALVAKKPRSDSDNRRLMMLILRAAIEADRSFQALLSDRELRSTSNIDLALSAYDYTLNHSEGALDHILAALATDPIGADADAIVVLSCLDEWDRSVRAFRKHFIHTDGAGGECMSRFMETRAYLYPAQYRDHAYDIEAPITLRPLVPSTTTKPNKTQ